MKKFFVYLLSLGHLSVDLAPGALPAAKHIFSHIEWYMSGILLHLPAQSAPAGCVWASRAELNGEYAVPSAFAGIMRQWQPE